MAKSSANDSPVDVPAVPSVTDKGDGGSSPRLQGLDSNPQGAFGPRVWRAFRDNVTHIYDTVSLPDPSEEARFTLSSRTYATPRGILMRCEGTAFIMTRAGSDTQGHLRLLDFLGEETKASSVLVVSSRNKPWPGAIAYAGCVRTNCLENL